MTAVWAHRGASRVCTENTLAAFAEARALGADGVELDVRRSRDDGLVVHWAARLPDGRLISETPVADLPPHVPLLPAALDACAGMTVNIEIKNRNIEPDFDPTEFVARAVIALLAESRAPSDVIVSSFNLDAINVVAQLDASVRCGYLLSATWNQERALARAADAGHSAIHPHHSALTPGLVDHAHDIGLAVHVWTVDDPDRIRWVHAAGVDAVITSVPDVARAVLG